MTTRGRCKLLVFCLLAGAVINVAVAWRCAIFLKPDWTKHHPVSRSDATLIMSTYAPDSWRAADYGGQSHRNLGVVIESVDASRPDTEQEVSFFDEPRIVVRERVGWPALSLVTGVALGLSKGEIAKKNDTSFTIPLHTNPAGDKTGPWLPYGLLWLGLIINTLFYAAIAWLIVRSPLETRRRLRQWRGLCEEGAYPIGESPVGTECGEAIRTRSQVT